MNSTFLLCGYPRSRTQWLANFFSMPGVCECEHEATQYAGSSQEFWERADDICREPVYGNSDSGNILVLPALLAARPLTKVVWVERPIVEVARSLHQAGFPCTEASMRLLLNHRDAYRELFDLVVDFHQLGQLAVIQILWHFLLGSDVPFDCGRWGILEGRRLAPTFKDYQGRDLRKFFEFLTKEGEATCLTI
jgi:hypothetical protein